MDARTLLHQLARQRGWTYEDFRRAYERAAGEVARRDGRPRVATATVAEQTYRRWTAGKVRTLPAPPAPAVLEHLFGRPAVELLAEPDPESAVATASVIDEGELLMTARDAADHARDAAAQALPDLSIDQLEDDVRALARAYHRTPPREAFDRGSHLLDAARDMLDRTQRSRQRDRLYLQAGQAAALLGSVSFDLGSLPSAVQLARTAALYGEVIDHGPLQAYARGALAYMAYWDGRPAEAVRMVREAGRFGGLGDTARHRLAVIQGRALAHLRQQDDAVAVMRTAQDATGERDELHDDVAGEFGMPRDRIAMSNATSHLLMGNAHGAEAEAERALSLLGAAPAGQRSISTEAKARTDLARARVLRREVEGAADALEKVLALDSPWRTAGLLERVSAVRMELMRTGQGDASAARELGGRIEHWSAHAAGRALGAVSRLALEC
ncbi:hypothetical protein [Streptomyces aidingensis]|uniref:Uncharacterized protein n=1 Tax=Streptomyces aidingensis TaxID=910347 RepID=A0A1I1H232_9ACTN|nr:hypothetical protein [Streptomyces aidingensis]SFC18209.1 hypothetical protein SAMN05421773_102229 [Streptomyces aidingensis]